MSEENVERLRVAYAALADGDLAPVLELCDEHVEVIEPPEIPDSSTFRGRSGVLAVLEKLRDVFPDLLFQPYEFAGSAERVLVSIRWRGSGVGSGAPGEVDLFHLWAFEGRTAVRVQAYLNREQALEAAGLPE